MDTVAVFIFSLSFPLLCVLTVFPSAGQAVSGLFPHLSLVFLLSLSGGFFFRKRRQFLFITGIVCLTICCVLYLCSVFHYYGTEDRSEVCAVEGTLIRDSSYGSSGNLVLSLYLEKAQNNYGNTVSVRGSIRAVSKERAVLCAGTKVRLEGSFSGDLFVCSRENGLAVTSKGRLNFIRENLILLMQKRLENCSMGEMLLLGRTGRSEELATLASQCGCMHVLALSGMHLNIIGGGVYRTVKKLTGRKTPARILSIVSALVFLLAAGPGPSLLRSFLFFVLFFLPSDERLAAAFIIQLAFFPWTVFTQGAAYGYISAFALIFLSPYVRQTLRLFLPDAAAGLAGASAAVLLLNAPLQILLTGEWHPAALLAGPFAALVVSLQMSVCLICLAFPLPFFQKLSGHIASFLAQLFTFAGRLPAASWTAFAVFAACIVFAGAASRAVGWQLRRKYIKS